MMLAVSLLSRAHANWAAPTYVSATVLVVAWALQRGWRSLVTVSIALHLAAAVLLFTGREAAAAFGLQLPAEYDPLRRLRGWRDLGREVGAALAAHPGLTLFADDRELLAALIYYVRPHPFDAAKWQLTGRARDQWDLTDSLPKHRGGNFLLVSEHELVDEMRPSFAAIERLRPIVIPLGPGAARTYTLYLARDFKGYPTRSLSRGAVGMQAVPDEQRHRHRRTPRSAAPSPAQWARSDRRATGISSMTLSREPRGSDDQDILAGVVVAFCDQAILPCIRAEADDRDPAAERIIDFASVDPSRRRDDQPRPVEEAALAELLSQ